MKQLLKTVLGRALGIPTISAAVAHAIRGTITVCVEEPYGVCLSRHRGAGHRVLALFGLLAVPIAPPAWAAARDLGFTGRFSVNDKLAKLERIDLGGGVGPEHIAFGPDGKLYTAVLSGTFCA